MPREEVEPAVEPLEQLSRREQLHARSGELERERKAVEPAAELGDVLQIGRTRLVAVSDGARPLEEELRCRRRLERLDRVLVLALEPKHLAARDDDGEPRRGPQQARHVRRGRDDLLEVVEHEYERVRCERLGEPLRQCRTAHFSDSEGVRQRLRNEACVGERREVHECNLAALGRNAPRNLEREPRLPNPSRSRTA